MVIDIQTAILMSSMSLPLKRYYRFTNLEARNGVPPIAPGVSDFGLLMRQSGGRTDSCLVSKDGDGNVKLEVEGASLILTMHDNYCEGCSQHKVGGVCVPVCTLLWFAGLR